MTPQQPVGPSADTVLLPSAMVEEDHPMGIKLDISMETPLSADGRDILAGISAFVWAAANRQDIVDQAEASAQEEEDELEPRTRGSVAPDASGSCVREIGHSGRHEYGWWWTTASTMPSAEVYFACEPSHRAARAASVGADATGGWRLP